jgi:hypothetical protein
MDLKELERELMAWPTTSLVYHESQLVELIRKFCSLRFPEETLSHEDELHVLRRLKSVFQTTQDDAHVLEEGHEDWIQTVEQKHHYFDDYMQLLKSKGFADATRTALRRDTRTIVEHLANPESTGRALKRGLVVGHVQSGKTSSFIGVISMAADYGYKVIVVLSGVQNLLRQQTQARLDESFIGLTWDTTLPKPKFVRIGVGLHGERKSAPHHSTNMESDFNAALMSGISLSGATSPVVFVCKKNLDILNNLSAWVEQQRGSGRYVDSPVLVIDDEADNATINVGHKDNPTKINKAIRTLLNQFRVSTYVGYTATPYANIFIEPPTDNQMENADLFPKDFIVALSPPSNYIGASSLFSEEGQYRSGVNSVCDYVDVLPLNHKKSHMVGKLPDSLKRAVYSWYICCAIRYLRGQSTWHMSMMVNVSRFISVQRQIGDLILVETEAIKDALVAFANMEGQWDSSDILIELRSILELEYPEFKDNWNKIVSALSEFCRTVHVRVKNGNTVDKLDYDSNRKSGLHVIAVGGLALSRGFTLEGLSTTYILRNAGAYDTLMQMGRWFGYRDDYADLTRIYMPKQSVEWYEFVNDATNELYASFVDMCRANRKPINFGLQVRHHSALLQITARNKMKHAHLKEMSISVEKQLFETVYVHESSVPRSIEALENLLETIKAPQELFQSTYLGQYESSVVRKFLDSIDFSTKNNSMFSERLYSRLIVDLASAGMTSWDIATYAGSASEAKIGKFQIQAQRRISDFVNDGETIRINRDKMRVASRGAEKLGLSDAEEKSAEAEFNKHKATLEQSIRNSNNISDVFYRSARKRPLLMLHVIQPYMEPEEKHPKFIVAIGLSIPKCKDLNSESIIYAINETKLQELQSPFSDIEGELEDDV